MRAYSLRHLTDTTLRYDLKQLVITDRGTTAHLIAHIAEFLVRKLYLEDGYASMYDYCVGELGMSEDIACRRIHAARAARRFPLIFPALADGRIHLTAVSLLARRLTEENAEARPVHSSAPARIDLPPPCVTPLAPGHRRSNPDGRHVPAEVRRAVWRRDGGRCTFTSDTGRRCEERKDLQFDHVEPYARGGAASIGGIRLLCRAHNQYEAERVLGSEFMRHRREAARIRVSEGGARRPSSAGEPTGGRR